MSKLTPSEDEYYQHIDHDLQQGAYDFVASLEEWRLFKAALTRWVEDQERGWDQAAVESEHQDD